ncbi:MAG: FliO/MopB family protein [Deltaproteobacteria bacterium]
MCRRALMLATVCGLFLGAAARASDATSRDSRLLPPRGADPALQNEGKPAVRGSQRNRPAGDGWLTTLGSLAAVLAFVFLAAKVLKRNVPAAQKTLPVEVVQVLGRKALDYQHTIHLVRFGSKMLMLGTSQEGMRTLSEITDPVEIDCLAGLCKPSEPPSVAGTFSQLLQRFQSPEAAPPEADSATGREAEAEAASPVESDPDPAILQLERRLRRSAHAVPSDGGRGPSTEAAG